MPVASYVFGIRLLKNTNYATETGLVAVTKWSFSNTYPQQLLAPLLQSQEGGPPLIRLLMIAAAHPTPVFTVIAPNSQFRAQAPHSMHRSRSVTVARLSCISNTP